MLSLCRIRLTYDADVDSNRVLSESITTATDVLCCMSFLSSSRWQHMSVDIMMAEVDSSQPSGSLAMLVTFNLNHKMTPNKYKLMSLHHLQISVAFLENTCLLSLLVT